jgi:hypothetical protein
MQLDSIQHHHHVFRTVTICSTVNRFCFTANLPSGAVAYWKAKVSNSPEVQGGEARWVSLFQRAAPVLKANYYTSTTVIFTEFGISRLTLPTLLL